MALYIIATSVNLPAIKVMEVIDWSVGSTYRIELGGVGVIRTEQHLVGTGNHIALIQICHRIGFENHRVDIQLRSVRHTGVQSVGDSVAHRREGHALCDIRHIIRGIGGPTTKLLIGSQRTYTRVIDDVIEMGSVEIRFLHINRHDTTARQVEVHLQTRIIAGLGHNIDGEGVCGKDDFTVLWSHRGHKLKAVGTLMPHVHQLAVREIRVGDGDHRRLSGLRLPFVPVLGDGDVIRAIELLAPCRGTSHGSGAHRYTRRHLAGDREGELPSVGGSDVSIHRDLPSVGKRSCSMDVVALRQCDLALRHGTEPHTKNHHHNAQNKTNLQSFRVDFFHNMFFYFFFLIFIQR